MRFVAPPAFRAARCLVVGCVSQSSPRDPAEKCGEPVRGDRSQMATPIAAPTGPTIDAPKLCEDHGGPGAYIRVHGHGTRPIEMGPDARTRCTSGAGCVFADDFGRAVIARLGQQHIETIGLGLGVCGDSGGDYDAWNVSIASSTGSTPMRRSRRSTRDLPPRCDNSFGVSVRGISCSVPE
jgi:hypothetical protein